MNTIKYERIKVVIPSGTTARLHPLFQKTLDNQFKNCVGVGISEVSNGGLTRYDIGVKDRAGKRDLIDLHDKQFFIAGSSMNINERFRTDIQFPISNEAVAIQIETFDTTTSDLVLQVVFKLQA